MPAANPNRLRVALVVPHIFISHEIFDRVIFSPGALALDLAASLGDFDIDCALFTPLPAGSKVKNITADPALFNKELENRGYDALTLLKKHPATFVALSRQLQSEIISKAYKMANDDHFDLVHIYTNEEDIALHFAQLCRKPVVFTHHDPFNFLIKYKSVFPKYQNLNWISMSLTQRTSMPSDTNWVANIPHGVDPSAFNPCFEPDNYLAYTGRIIEPKGVHLAIKAVELHNKQNPKNKLKLKIAGKHYSSATKDNYWTEKIAPELSEEIEYLGFLKGDELKNHLRKALALLVPSTFEEPFGMVTLEALASGTPVLGLSAGATKEIVKDGETGFIVPADSEQEIIENLAAKIARIDTLSRQACRASVENNFTLAKMTKSHADLYRKLL